VSCFLLATFAAARAGVGRGLPGFGCLVWLDLQTAGRLEYCRAAKLATLCTHSGQAGLPPACYA